MSMQGMQRAVSESLRRQIAGIAAAVHDSLKAAGDAAHAAEAIEQVIWLGHPCSFQADCS